MDLIGTYEVYLDTKRVGSVVLTQRGLYYVVHCLVQISEKKMIHLVAYGEDWTEDLGLMAPCHSGFELKRELPMKRLGKGVPRFVLQERSEQAARGIEIQSELPFPELWRLEDSYLEIRGKASYICFRKNSRKKEN